MKCPHHSLFIAVALALSACGSGSSKSPSGDGGVPADAGGDRDFTTCAAPCHGSEGNPAPPFDTHGNSDTSARGVGAHRSHSGASLRHREVPCDICHVVPKRVDDPGHLGTDRPAEVTFIGIAEGTSWDGEACSGSYCHGAALTGGHATAPVWTVVDGSQSKCDSCHGTPPPAPHPDREDCSACHPTMNPGEGLAIAYPDLHVDGKLDVIDSGGCDRCHGSDGNPAPPADVGGHTSTSARGVGAHRSHLGASSWHQEVRCEACHVVPSGISDIGHRDTPLPAEITFGALAGAGVWNGTSCSDVYCHGASLSGGTVAAPVWTEVDGSQAQCDSCHGAPPPAPHPANEDCGQCHPTMVPGGGMAIAYPASHIDGNLDVKDDLPCDGCHGGDGIAAPPVDVSGNTATSAVGVGAHRSHLGPSSRNREVPCESCHLVPTSTASLGHTDSELPAEVVFGGLAGAGAVWDGSTCAGSYCHGATLTGGTATEPQWTVVDGSQAQCDSCHGAPPPPPHIANENCGLCHQTMEPGAGLVIADPSRHIDGTTDVLDDLACDSCHGSDGNAAPPQDIAGNTSTSVRGVGAHRNHLGGSDWHKEHACNDCHIVPTAVGALGHADTPLPAELTFSALAGPAVWNGSTCANSYCHGSSISGGAATTPVWTLVDGSQVQCDSCHGAPPPPPHPTNPDCGVCHPTMTPGAATTTASPELHIDGNLDVSSDEPCDSCHGGGGVAAPPLDVLGNSSTSARGVGAHRNHLRASDWRAPIACDQCHQVPTTVNAVGHRDTDLPAELQFGALAGAVTWNGSSCSGSYCHGATLTGGSATAPVWTTVDGSQAQCDSCHGAPPPAPHTSNTDCGLCHQSMTPGEGLVISDPARHIDGTLDVVDDAPCDSCHGSGGNPAPPVDVDGSTSTSARGVGAHRAHLGGSSWHLEIACNECHIVPTALGAVGHIDTPPPAELTFGTLAGPTVWNGVTCSGSYCHGATLVGGTATAPVWTVVDGSQSRCDSCHGAPPPSPHTSNTDCGLCHASMTPGGGLVITNPALHIDGNLDVTEDAPCDSCHGGGGVSAPPVDVAGNSTTAARGVGAHRAHLGPSSWHAEVACDECHRVPTSVGSSGHTDSALPAELTFGALAGSVSWNGATCSGSYCHGATLSGGSDTAPIWTTVDGSQTQCDSCHGNPPPAPHTDSTACETCHGQVIGAGGAIVAPGLHIDGVLQVVNVHDPDWAAADQHGYAFDQGGPSACAGSTCHGATLTGGSGGTCENCHSGWKTTCTFCHGGTDNMTGAPPESIYGVTSRSNPYVGAHTEHVEDTNMHAAWDCGECHVKPSSAMSPQHVDGDGEAEVVFSSLNPVASYSATSGDCANLYCHGDGRNDNGTATWSANPTLSCSSCHSATGSGLSGRHSKHASHGITCDECHSTVVDAGMGIIGLALHVDGVPDVDFAGPGTYDPSNGRCSGLNSGPCHDPETW